MYSAFLSTYSQRNPCKSLFGCISQWTLFDSAGSCHRHSLWVEFLTRDSVRSRGNAIPTIYMTDYSDYRRVCWAAKLTAGAPPFRSKRPLLLILPRLPRLRTGQDSSSLSSSLRHLPYCIPSMLTVSKTSPEAASSSDYEMIFDNALKAYKKKTGKDLASDPLLHRLETCNSPDSVLALLKDQIPAFDKSGGSDERLTKWVNPAVNVLYNFAATIGGAVGLVSFVILGTFIRDLRSDVYL